MSEMATSWVQKAVNLCINVWEREDIENHMLFSELEEQYQNFAEQDREHILYIMRTQFAVQDLLFILSCFVQYMKIPVFKEMVFECIERGDFDADQSCALELQTAFYIPGYYKQKRQLHKRNIEKYEEVIKADYPYHTLEERNEKRIIIVTDQLVEIVHAPTRIVRNVAYILQERLGYEVLIFVCPPDRGVEMELWYQSRIQRSDKYYYTHTIELEHMGAKLHGYQINMTESSQKEYSMMLELIHAWNPLFVFNLGAWHPVVELTKKFTTLVTMDMSSECPVSEGDILIRPMRVDEERERIYEEETAYAGQKQIFMDEPMPALITPMEEVYTREELHLPENKFLIAIVGNRLDREVDEEFAKELEKILDNNEEAILVFIGKKKVNKEYFSQEIWQHRVYDLGYCEELMKVYGALDLYVNPKRMGGGYSSIFAAIAGLPVVTLPDCDVANNVGEQFVVNDYSEMVDIVGKYIKDKEFYEEKKKCALQVAKINSEEKMVDYISRMLHRITEVMEKQ
ncbi:MAG: glycosyltransferase [Lachnospiraceae bacterium]|nr:glycosyltransferase [Lachnospiraceae bacterium]